jgi:hypothetical protein
MCDASCSDLNLRLLKDGRTLDEDVADDDAPVMMLKDFPGGLVTVRVEMRGCSASTCAYRVIVLAK